MPQWIECTLNDIGEIVGGATPATAMKKYYGGKIPWITPKDLSSHQERYIAKGERNITSAGLNSCSTRLLPKNTILFTSRAPIGYIAISSTELCTNQGFKSIIPKEGIDKLFVYYLLIYNRNKIISMGSGTTFKEISGKVMKSIDVKIPQTIQHQRKIASILGRIDDKIELNNKINDNLQQQAFALFDRLMIEAVDTECQVSEIAYLNPKRPLAKNKVARCIDMSQLSTSRAFPSGWEMKPFTGGMRFTNGDTLLARITPCLENGKTAYIDFLDDEEIAFGSTEYIVLAPKEDIPPEYLYCLARYPAFVDYAVKNMNGSSGRQRVSADTIGQFVMPCPSETAIKDFGKVASALFMKMKNNSLENLKLSSLRDTILPKLMAGEIDVSNIQF